MLSKTIQDNSIVIEKYYEDDLKIMIKNNDLVQVILNLLVNSIDAYMLSENENKIIKIYTKEEDTKIVIKIKDNAGGIPAEIIDRIFEPYFSTKDKKNGTGIGLYMSKLVVESHLNGTINVQSNDKSTTFTVAINKEQLI